MVASVKTSVIAGLDAQTVDVEVVVYGKGQPRFVIIGLADHAVRESRDRVSAALRNAGFYLPSQILVSLAPAEVKKEGSALDLPIAIAVLCAIGVIAQKKLTNRYFHGELGLNGEIKQVRGIVASAVHALSVMAQEIIIPTDNCSEASLITGVPHVGVSNLKELIRYLNHDEVPLQFKEEKIPSEPQNYQMSLSEVRGQEGAKRALIVAAAGGHNILLIGPPGCGKSMLAERMRCILPPLTNEEMLETIRIHSIAGLPIEKLLNGIRPYRSPHYGVSDAGLIGGGSTIRPGEISLSHNGVLFLDEFPEFRRSAIESLRAPLESSVVHIARSKGSLHLPARFQLVAAMNSCPCGRLGLTNPRCTCSQLQIQNYLRKLSQPVLERIDIHVELNPVQIADIQPLATQSNDDSKICNQILEARDRQYARFNRLNAHVPASEFAKGANISTEAKKLFEERGKTGGISMRSYVRLIRVARTLADLYGSEVVSRNHAAEALGLRAIERIGRYVGM